MQDGTEMINKYRICPACKRFTLAERCFCEYCGQNISNDPLIQYVKKENPSINESLDAIPKIEESFTKEENESLNISDTVANNINAINSISEIRDLTCSNSHIKSYTSNNTFNDVHKGKRECFKNDKDKKYNKKGKAKKYNKNDKEKKYNKYIIANIIMALVIVLLVAYIFLKPDNSSKNNVISGLNNDFTKENIETNDHVANDHVANDDVAKEEVEEYKVEILATNIKIRNYPSIKMGEHVGKVSEGQTYVVLGKLHREGYDWYKLDEEKWIADDGTYLKVIGNNNVPSIDFPRLYILVSTSNAGSVHSDCSFSNNVVGEIREGDVFRIYDIRYVDNNKWFKIGDELWVSESASVYISSCIPTEYYLFKMKVNRDVTTHIEPSGGSESIGVEIYTDSEVEVEDIKYNSNYTWYQIGEQQWIRNHGNTFDIQK